ncbi:M23 family metallopeptidase [Treponema sp. TIM-1]|uniref:M23 family metallopeptidase n=1 Tax=Treponema sp. TIM-1 TaxID=2898417 RepID=UPI00397F4D24
MASVHKYKRVENNLVLGIKSAARAAGRRALTLLKASGRVITQRYTVVVVPHSEKRVYNLQVTVFSLLCFVLIFIGMAGVFFFYGLSTSGTRRGLTDNDPRLNDAQASLDQLRDEIALLLRQSRGFQATLSNTLSTLGTDASGGNAGSAAGELSSFFDIRELSTGTLQEVTEVQQLAAYLSAAVEPLQELRTILDSQNTLLTEIPSIWPIKGGIGHISSFFGQNIHPFTGQYYIHKGIDLSTYRQGDPIVATADGQVVTVDSEQGGFGNYIIIRHKHGFYTRYAHLLSFRVTTGQRVQQGEIIGYIGNTGLSTGPHLHYEVHIGSDVVDPFKFITIRSNNSRNGL